LGLVEPIRKYLAENEHDLRTLLDEEAASVVGSLSLCQINIIPPPSDATIDELVPMMLRSPGARNLPYGIMVLDNRQSEIPANRSQVSGPILGSVF
jgi:hypothetical protein